MLGKCACQGMTVRPNEELKPTAPRVGSSWLAALACCIVNGRRGLTPARSAAPNSIVQEFIASRDEQNRR